MDKKLVKELKNIRKFKNLGLVYFKDNEINPIVEPNLQLLALIIEGMDPIISMEEYDELKHNEDALAWQLALSTFDEESLVSDEEVFFRANLIQEYFNLEPIPIGDEYTFAVNGDKLYELHQKALHQVNEGKFKDITY